jgi:uncharacterized membrane protein
VRSRGVADTAKRRLSMQTGGGPCGFRVLKVACRRWTVLHGEDEIFAEPRQLVEAGRQRHASLRWIACRADLKAVLLVALDVASIVIAVGAGRGDARLTMAKCALVAAVAALVILRLANHFSADAFS